MRLTKVIKAHIITAVTEEALKGRVEAWVAEAKRLGPKVYSSRVTAAQERKMRAMPSGFFTMMDAVQVCVQVKGGKSSTRIGMPYNALRKMATNEAVASYTSRLPVKRNNVPAPMPASAVHQFTIYPEDGELYDTAMSLLEKTRKMVDEYSTLEREVNSILSAVTTEKRLCEIWPEAVKYLPKDGAEPKSLPMVTASKLNAHIACMKEDTCAEVG